MIIDSLQSISPLSSLSISESSNLITTGQISGSSFLKVLEDKVVDTNHRIVNSNNLLEKYIRGEAVSAHDVMIALARAKSDFQLVVEVRNKVIDAYQELTRIQV